MRIDIDLDAVFKDRPHLRTGDKAVLRYIQKAGGAFVTDVRDGSIYQNPVLGGW